MLAFVSNKFRRFEEDESSNVSMCEEVGFEQVSLDAVTDVVNLVAYSRCVVDEHLNAGDIVP
jgi:hypothetical protein